MCGIVARVDGGECGAGVALLAERGPHGSAVWQRDALSLALARLAIVAPLEPARVHVHDASAAVMNGEIYEHRALRASLGVDASSSDQDLLPALYSRGGIAAIRALRAPVTCAIADVRAQTITLLRDRFGKRPLVVDVQDGAGVRSASEMKALIAMRGPSQPVRFDAAAIARFVSRGILEDDAPIVHGVESVAPGEVRVLAPPGTSPGAPPATSPGAPPGTSPGAPPDLLSALRDACRRRVQHLDVRAAVLLSGGLDSSVIAALVREHIGVAYTMRIRSSDTSDESDKARAMTDALGLELRVVDVEPPSFNDLAACAWRLEAPDAFVGFGVAHAYATLARKLRDDGVRVVVTGEGADELFLGYAWQRAQAAAQNGWPFPGTQGDIDARAYAAASMASPRDARALEVFLRARFGDPLAQSGQDVASLFNSAAVVAQPVSQARQQHSSRPASLLGAERRRADALAVDLPMWPLRIADRILMGHGIEPRAPFLDEDVVDFVLATPAHDQESATRDKPMLRALAADVLPANVDVAPKQGFAAWSWPGAPATRAWAAALARNGTLLVRADALDALAKTEGAEANAAALLAWRLVVLEVTARQLDAARTGAAWRP